MTQPQTMTTAHISAYGGPEVVSLQTASRPSPGPAEVLVRVLAAPVTAGDARIRSGKVPPGMGFLLRLAMGWNRPRNAPGWAFAGEVAALGADVRGFTAGQKVFGLTGIKGGAHAEYCAVKASGRILPLPDSLSLSEGAAFFFGGLAAADYLIDKARLQPGKRLLVNGATGAVGSAALQIARHIGAEITAVASSANHALARDLGAHHVHDYRQGPVSGQFDVVMDVIGTLGWPGCKPLLAAGGRALLVTAGLGALLGAALRPNRDGRKVIGGTSGESLAQMKRLVAFHKAGAYRPVVSQSLPFAEIARAHEIAETFHKPGNIIVQM